MKKQFPIPNRDYKVLCRCYTYNQAQYIEDTLNGFVMQQTDFPFVCLVVDDCSTDGEQDVIKAFLDRECNMDNAEYYEDDTTNVIYAQHNANTNCHMAVYLLKENLYHQKERKKAYVKPWRNVCEYEALCEGDDYWIDPLKIQKQADYMDSHNQCGMTCSNSNYQYSDTGVIKTRPKKCAYTSFDEILLKGGIRKSTCTVMLRTRVLDGYDKVIEGTHFKMGDFPLWLYISHRSEIYNFDDCFAIYRVLPESASHFKSYEKTLAFEESICNIQRYFAKLYATHLLDQLEMIRAKRMFYIAYQYRRTSDAFRFSKHFKMSVKDYIRLLKTVLFKDRY